MYLNEIGCSDVNCIDLERGPMTGSSEHGNGSSNSHYRNQKESGMHSRIRYVQFGTMET
jgi:hypothetical protein